MTVASLLVMGGAHVLGASLKAVVFAKSNSQSAELLGERIEQLRAADYAAVAMVSADLVGDPLIGGTPLDPTFDPDGSGPLGPERIVTAPTGSVSPHITATTRNAQEYAVATYVTQPVDSVDAKASYKNVTVQATWTTGTRTYVRQQSSYLTVTRRGLPLPNFQIASTASTSPIIVNAGARLTLPFKVVNRGARDGLNLAVTSTPSFAAAHVIGIVSDSEGSGYTAAPDADSNGVLDTGFLETDQVMSMVAVSEVPIAVVAGSYVMTVTGASIGQPDSAAAMQTVTFLVHVVNDSQCSGCTYRPLYLRNDYPACATPPCNTASRTNLPLRSDASTATELANFDTDVDTFAGRGIGLPTSTPDATSTDGRTMANWRFQVDKAMQLEGNVIIDLYVAVPGAGSSANDKVRLKAYVNRSTTGSGATQTVGSATHQLSALTTGYQQVRIVVPVAATAIANNRFIEIKIVVDVDGPSPSTNPISLAYDSAGYPAIVWVPVV